MASISEDGAKASDRVYQNYIDGRFEPGGAAFDDINPVNGLRTAVVMAADQAMVHRAVTAARRALTGPWASMPLQERLGYLHRLADGIEARFEDFLAAEIADTGKPVLQARDLDIPRGAANFRAFADLLKGASTECFEMDTPDGAGAINYAVRKPLGVVAVVAPWNLPFLLMTWKLAPALACGNTVVAKPSEETPATATLLAEVADEIGLPAGVINIVHGCGPGGAGEFLVGHPDVNAITFTGESQTGALIMRSAAEGIKPISFELGGKNAAIVFADADFDSAVDGVARSTFTNCGQVCLCSERVYVERPIFDRFVRALKEKAEALVMGDPYDIGTSFSPLVSHAHRDKVLSYFALAQQEGATVVTGGGIPCFGDEKDQGAYVEPTVLTGLSQQSRTMREEIFGPVCHVMPFDSEEEAVGLANDSDYGLAAAVWTTNLSRAHRVARRMDVGIAWVNTWFLRDLRTPFGGMKLSGIGREGGLHSLHFYSEPTNICIKL